MSRAVVCCPRRRANALLLGALFLDSDSAPAPACAEEVRERSARGTIIDGEHLAALKPRYGYQTALEVDRQIRLGGENGVVIWLPGQDSNLQPIG